MHQRLGEHFMQKGKVYSQTLKTLLFVKILLLKVTSMESKLVITQRTVCCCQAKAFEGTHKKGD
jgi:hypothetical protein